MAERSSISPLFEGLLDKDQRRIGMKLFDVPNNTRVRIVREDGYIIEVEFKHIDGMYSLCKLDNGGIVHLAAWTEVEIVEDKSVFEMEVDNLIRGRGIKMWQTCPTCGKSYQPKLSLDETGLKRWSNGALIQTVWPDSKPMEREQLMTGLCSKKCWNEYLDILEEEANETDKG